MKAETNVYSGVPSPPQPNMRSVSTASTAVQASLLRIYSLSHSLLDPRGLFHSGPKPDQRTLSGFDGNGITAIFLAAKRIAEMVKEGMKSEQSDPLGLYKTNQDGLQSGEKEINVSSVE